MTAHGIFTLELAGWDYQSRWGWDPSLETLYAQLTHNDSDIDADEEGPQIWITPPDFPRIRLPADLARAIAGATDAELTAVHAAMNAGLPEGPHPFRLPDAPANLKDRRSVPALPQIRRGFWKRRTGSPAKQRPIAMPEYGSQGRIASVDRSSERSPEELARQLRDFVADSVECVGMLNFAPAEKTASGRTLPPFLVVCVEPEITDPCLRKAFALVDEIGGIPAAEQMSVASSWTLMDGGGDICLIKLKLEFNHPWTARTDIAFVAVNYAEWWHKIAGGGMIAVTTRSRLDSSGGLKAGYFQVLDSCLPIEVASSPALQHLIVSRGWPIQ